MDLSHDNNGGDNSSTDLHSLLSQEPIIRWGIIYQRIQDHPLEAQDRYYRNESCLQLALKATAHNEHTATTDSISSRGEDTSTNQFNKIDVLRAIVDIDPESIHWRDDEGRTPLHTACSAGCSFEILQWLIDEEKIRLKQSGSNNSSIDNNAGYTNATLRTDFPGGSLALHSIVACSDFDDSCFQTNSKGQKKDVTDQSFYCKCSELFQDFQLSVQLTPNIVSAYASTMTIIRANQNAIWERDCEGELPLHSAASYGNIGCLMALLIATEEAQPYSNESTDCADKISSVVPVPCALVVNDRQKTPLTCACERVVAFSVHTKQRKKSIAAVARRSELNSLRVTMEREDPFEDWSTDRSRDSARRRHLGGSLGGRLGYGSGVRSSLSTSFVLSGGRFGRDDNLSSVALRTSFSSTRRPVHPVFGLEALDEDGEAEFAKVELLARSACGCINLRRNKVGPLGMKNDSFHLVHELIKCSAPPEVIWHAAQKNHDELTIKDDLGRSPLFLACERLVKALVSEDDDEVEEQGSGPPGDTDELVKSAAARIFVESFFLGEDNTLPEFPNSLNGDSLPTISTTTEGVHNSRNRRLSLAPQHEVSSATEIINMLLCSEFFGNREMASMPDNKGRLPLHILLEAEKWTYDGNEEQPHPIKTLIDAYPLSLESGDGVSGLYPFMLAATASSGEDDGLSTVETVYRLLIESPSVISLCL